MRKHVTINDSTFNLISEDFEFTYQNELTKSLDKHQGDINQSIINEIVLWKVNRYAQVDKITMELLNQVSRQDQNIDFDLTKNLLSRLLRTKGIQLAMASTILRFKNPSLFQIIDQRVYRLLYDEEMKLSTYPSEKNIVSQTELYFNYLEDLRKACDILSIPFDDSDRILFMADKRVNAKRKLKNY